MTAGIPKAEFKRAGVLQKHGRKGRKKRSADDASRGWRHYADAQYFREGDQKVANCLLFRKDRVLHRLPDPKL